MTEQQQHAAKQDDRQPVGQTISAHPEYRFPTGKATPGEKAFESGLYIGLGYIINLASSIAITEFMLFGKGKKALWDPSEKLMTGVFRNFGMQHESATRASNITQKYFWLTSGGTALMVPTKFLEDRKSKLVYLLNRTFFPHTIAADDPYRDVSAMQILSEKFDENCLPQPVKEQPKHGWLKTIGRRVLGVGLVTGWGNLVDRTYGSEKYEKDIYKLINKGIDATASTSMANLAKNERFERYATWTVVDGINTAITSATTYFTNGAEKETPEEAAQANPQSLHHEPCLPVERSTGNSDFTKASESVHDEAPKHTMHHVDSVAPAVAARHTALSGHDERPLHVRKGQDMAGMAGFSDAIAQSKPSADMTSLSL